MDGSFWVGVLVFLWKNGNLEIWRRWDFELKDVFVKKGMKLIFGLWKIGGKFFISIIFKIEVFFISGKSG